jgi:hypothetical protein
VYNGKQIINNFHLSPIEASMLLIPQAFEFVTRWVPENAFVCQITLDNLQGETLECPRSAQREISTTCGEGRKGKGKQGREILRQVITQYYKRNAVFETQINIAIIVSANFRKGRRTNELYINA